MVVTWWIMAFCPVVINEEHLHTNLSDISAHDHEQNPRSVDLVPIAPTIRLRTAYEIIYL